MPGIGRAGRDRAVQAAWINDAEFFFFPGYFLAMDKGFYAERGLDDLICRAAPTSFPSSIIAARADLALTTPTPPSAPSSSRARSSRSSAPSIKSPHGIISLAKTPINSPADLVGKTVAVPPVNVATMEALLKINNVDRNAVNIVPYAYDPTPLVKGEIDASLDFVTNVPIRSSRWARTAQLPALRLRRHRFNDTVVVTEETLAAKRAELVALAARQPQGWDENLVDPAKYPPQWEQSWFKGTGRTIANEVYFNTAQRT